MEFEYKYKDLKERKEKIKTAEDKGQMMLHDNFDSDWKKGDEPHGTMIFTDVIPPSPIAIDWKAEFAKAKTDGERISVIAKRLSLKE